jgi:hypothetical protein
MYIGMPLRSKGMSLSALTIVPVLITQPIQTEIALAEVGAPFKRCEIDLENKPEWYAPKVNPASKVCAATAK